MHSKEMYTLINLQMFMGPVVTPAAGSRETSAARLRRSAQSVILTQLLFLHVDCHVCRSAEDDEVIVVKNRRVEFNLLVG